MMITIDIVYMSATHMASMMTTIDIVYMSATLRLA